MTKSGNKISPTPYTSIDALNDLLVHQSDLHTALGAGLRAILKYLNRDTGAVFLQSQDDSAPSVAVHYQLADDWISQVPVSRSRLRRWVRAIIEPEGEYYPDDLSAMVIPILDQSYQLGILLLPGTPLTPEENRYCTAACRALGRAVHIYRNFHPVHQTSRRLDELSEVSSQFDPSRSIDQILMDVARTLLHAFDCQAVAISMLPKDPDPLILKKIYTGGDEWNTQLSVPRENGFLGLCLKEKTPFLVHFAESDRRYHPLSDGIPGIADLTILIAPLLTHRGALGVLELHNKRTGIFGSEDEGLFIAVAAQISSAIANLQQISDLRILNAHLESSRWELARSRNTLRSLFDNLPDPLYITNRNYHLIAINYSSSKRAKRDPRQMVGKICYEAIYSRSEPCPGCLVEETFLKGRTTHRTERTFDNPKESQEWEISTYPITNDSGQVVQVIIFEQDVTEKRRLEAMIGQSEKMAAVGQLSAGIAHEINNPLTAVMVNAQILQRELPKDNADWQESVDLITRAGTRALQVVRNLLNFARKESYEFIPTNINDTIQDALDMLRHEFVSRDMQFTFEPSNTLQRIKGSPDHLQGVWMNIILNAMDASENGKGHIRIRTYQSDNQVHVEIADNGQGISQESISMIFEPFYTTKGPGRGTGLGLSVCHRIIKNHGGHILVDSSIGSGTTFDVILPVD